MNVLLELQQLNTEDPGSWPVVFKVSSLVVLLVSIIAAGYFLDWQEQWDTLDNVRAEEETLKLTYLAKKRSVVNLDLLKQQLQEIEKLLDALLRRLPNKAEMEALLIDINQAGLGRGLKFELFKPAASETFNEFYAELPITVRVTGGFHDISAFASDISLMPRIVTLNDISLKPDSEGVLILDAVAKTYRFLDEEDVVNSGEEMP